MRIIKFLAAAGLFALMTSLAGCAARVGVPPTVTYVDAPPPPAVVEVRPVIPFYGAVWIGGHYEHRHNRYHWLPGRYVRPPHPRARWAPGRWKHHRRGWRWHKGYWR